MGAVEVTLGEVATDSRATAVTGEAIEADTAEATVADTAEATAADMAEVTVAGMAEVTVAGMEVGAAAGAAVMAVGVGVGADWDLDCILRLFRFITTRCGQTECLTIMPTAITSRGTAMSVSMKPSIPPLRYNSRPRRCHPI